MPADTGQGNDDDAQPLSTEEIEFVLNVLERADFIYVLNKDPKLEEVRYLAVLFYAQHGPYSNMGTLPKSVQTDPTFGVTFNRYQLWRIASEPRLSYSFDRTKTSKTYYNRLVKKKFIASIRNEETKFYTQYTITDLGARDLHRIVSRLSPKSAEIKDWLEKIINKSIKYMTCKQHRGNIPHARDSLGKYECMLCNKKG